MNQDRHEKPTKDEDTTKVRYKDSKLEHGNESSKFS